MSCLVDGLSTTQRGKSCITFLKLCSYYKTVKIYLSSYMTLNGSEKALLDWPRCLVEKNILHAMICNIYTLIFLST